MKQPGSIHCRLLSVWQYVVHNVDEMMCSTKKTVPEPTNLSITLTSYHNLVEMGVTIGDRTNTFVAKVMESVRVHMLHRWTFHRPSIL